MIPEPGPDDLPECSAGACCSSVDEIMKRFEYVKGIKSRTGDKTFHVVAARGGYYAFVETNGKFYATSDFPTLEKLEGYVF